MYIDIYILIYVNCEQHHYGDEFASSDPMESGPTARPKKIMFWGAGATAALLGGIVVALKKKSPGPSSPAS